MAIDVTWLPVSTSLPPRPRLAGVPVVTQTYVPIPNPSPPTELTWQGSAAPPLWPHRLPSQGTSVTFVSAEVLPNVAWLPHEPRRVWPTRVLSGGVVLAAGASILQVPSFASWLPMQRGLVSIPRRLVGGSWWVIDPGTLIAAASCVEWDETTLVRPTIDTEILTRPSMTCDVEGAGFLLLEDGGFLLLEDGGKILLEDQTPCVEEALTRSMMVEETIC